MLEKFDFKKALIDYVEETVKKFMRINGLKDKDYDDLKNDALEAASKTNSILDYFDTLTNGVVKKVKDFTGKPFDDVCDEFTKAYYSGIEE
ncbi:MAG: hypothetical protein J6W12_04260 [Bacteroidales bacterium]|nr:hypothetical protein [Bacteroidales bacterium]